MDPIIAGAVGVAGTMLGGGGVWTWLAARQRARKSPPAAIAEAQADMAESQAALVEAINKQTQAFVDELQAERRELRATIARQSKSIKRLVGRVEHLEAENETCRAEGRQLQQHISSLESRLRDLGINIPQSELSGALLIIEDGKASLLKPAG